MSMCVLYMCVHAYVCECAHFCVFCAVSACVNTFLYEHHVCMYVCTCVCVHLCVCVFAHALGIEPRSSFSICYVTELNTQPSNPVLFQFYLLILFYVMGVQSVCISVHHFHAQCLQRTEASPWNRCYGWLYDTCGTEN